MLDARCLTACLTCAFSLAQVTLAQIMWQEGGVPVVTVSNGEAHVCLVEDETGGTYLAWADSLNGPRRVFAQHLDISGNRLWGDSGVRACRDTFRSDDPRIIADGDGGVIVAWSDDRWAGHPVVNAQRLRATGTRAWGPDGVPVCTLGFGPILTRVSDSSFAVCFEIPTGHGSFMLQRMDLNGQELWGPQGRLIDVSGGYDWLEMRAVMTDGQGGAYVAWEHNYWEGTPPHYQYGYSIFVRRVDAGGATAMQRMFWRVDFQTSMMVDLISACADMSGGAFAVWPEWFLGPPVIGRFTRDTLRWSTCVAPRGHLVSGLVPDGRGGAINLIASSDLRIQRSDSSGRLWGDSGVAVDGYVNQPAPAIAADDSAGAVAAYCRSWLGALRAKWLRANGDSAWSTALCPDQDSVTGSQLVNDRHGGTVVAWTGKRDGQWRIYAQRLNTYARPAIAEDARMPTAAVCGAVKVNPSPFHSCANISLDLSHRADLIVRVFSASGELVRSLRAPGAGPGSVVVTWDGKDEQRNAVPPGLYFCRAESGGTRQTAKMVRVE